MSIFSGLLGALGPVVFTVSDTYIKTFQDLELKQSSKFVDHEVNCHKPISERTGENLDELRFTMQLTTHYNFSPLIDLAVLQGIKDYGESQRLIVGFKNFGKFTLRELSSNWLHISGKGIPQILEVELLLVEHVETFSNQAMTAISTDEAMKSQTGKGGPSRLPGSSDALKSRELTPF